MGLSQNDIAAVEKVLSEHQRILITPHANVDADGLSSALALYAVFTAMGKEATVICPDTFPESLSFLPGYEKLQQDISANKDFVITINLDEGVEVDKLRYTVEDSKVNIMVIPKKGQIKPQHISLGEGECNYDLILVVDTADLHLLGSLYSDHIDLFSQVPILNIDHHISNTGFGQVSLIDPTASSATEVLYNLFLQIPAFKEAMTPDIATLLLTGLISDTRSFQNPNTTPRSLEVAADLLEKGARQQEIIKNIYKTKPLSTLKIWGRALNHIQIDPSARIVWSSVSREDLLEMDAKSSETHGILDELISTIPDADVHILFTETEEGGGLKASMRSAVSRDASKIAAKLFGGGGHARAAGFKVKGFDNFQLEVLECIRKIKEELAQEDTEGIPIEPASKKDIPIASKSVPKSEPKTTPNPSSDTKSTDVDIVKNIQSKPKKEKEKGTDIVEGLVDSEGA
jgi:bifunctional oligoribonuclease and PAP phosphatase NrnA